MTVASSTRRPPRSLVRRICIVLEAVAPRALHYTDLARRLHEPNPNRIKQACVRGAHRGLLTWVREGTYTLRQPTTPTRHKET